MSGNAAPLPSAGFRLAGIEGLRAIAASSIVLLHVWSASAANGALSTSSSVGDAISALSAGVTLFFTLSGFLLYRPFADRILRGESDLKIRAYLWNRFLRVAPAYWFILLFVSLALGAANVRHGGHLSTGRLTDPVGLLQSFFLLQDYRGATMIIGIGPAWSLAVEVVFYVALPLMAIIALRIARRRHRADRRALVLLGPPFVLLVGGLISKRIVQLSPWPPTAGWGDNLHSVIERSFFAQADLFSFGMTVAVLYVLVTRGDVKLPRRWRPAAVALGLFSFISCAWTMHRGEQSYLMQNTGEALGIALLLATVVVPDARDRKPLRAVRILEHRALVAVGVASYSLFLWHRPLIAWLQVHHALVGGWAGLPVNIAITAAVSGSLSALTYRFVERPFLMRKRSTRADVSAVARGERERARRRGFGRATKAWDAAQHAQPPTPAS
jgi:peptidoglycan/LPS O-acetylase OafA/YrhL